MKVRCCAFLLCLVFFACSTLASAMDAAAKRPGDRPPYSPGQTSILPPRLSDDDGHQAVEPPFIPPPPLSEPQAAEGRAESARSIVVLMLLGIGLASAMLYWASKIGRDGYHRTQSNFPVSFKSSRRRSNNTNLTTPVP